MTRFKCKMKYDGTLIKGIYDFTYVVRNFKFCYKSNFKMPPFYAVIYLENKTYYVIMKRLRSLNSDQCLIDEYKRLFGLTPIGTHIIKFNSGLKRKDKTKPWESENITIIKDTFYYLIMRARVTVDDSNNIVFYSMVPISQIDYTDIQSVKPIYKEVQKILLFRYLFRIQNKSINDIYILNTNDDVLSINESDITPLTSNYVFTETLEKHFFPKVTSKVEILINMCGFTKELYKEQLMMLKKSIIKITTRINDERLWIVEYVVNKINDWLTIYYDNT